MIIPLYTAYALCAGILLTLFLISAKKGGSTLSCAEKTAKILVTVYVILSFLDLFLPDAFTARYLGERDAVTGLITAPSEAFARVRDPWHAVLRWAGALAQVTLPFAVFYRKKSFARVSAFMILPFSVIRMAYAPRFIAFFTDPSAPSVFGEGSRVLLQNEVFRSVWFWLLITLETVSALYAACAGREHLRVRSGKDLAGTAVTAAALILSCMPIYIPQHLFGTYTGLILTFLKPGYYVYIAELALRGFILYFILRKRNREDRYIALFVMTLSLLFQFYSYYRTDGVINASRWPLQMCNIAGIFYTVILLTRKEKLYHIAVSVNICGALVAVALCDSTYNTGILFCMNIHYMEEHTNVLLVPILLGALHVFSPLKKKDALHVIAGFSIYFVTVLIIGTVLTGLYSKTQNGFFSGVNYLFMFDAKRTPEIVPFSKPLFDASVTLFGHFTFSLAQIAIYAAFLLLSLGVFFLMYLFFREKKHPAYALQER